MSSAQAESTSADVLSEPWTGRDDGPGADNLRWHHVVTVDGDPTAPADVAFVGFRSDEGVRRNKGRQGAANGPQALRRALAPLALPAPLTAVDAGDVVVGDGDLESGQHRLGALVAQQLDSGRPVTVLGGGHEVAYGSYSGMVRSGLLRDGARLGVLNLDAHFDLRDDIRPSSGTPFLQMAQSEERYGRELNYRVLGVSQPSNTQRLFHTADKLGVRYLPDIECGPLHLAGVTAFVDEFLDSCDVVHLSVDLDVLPAGTAPGVSAPAAHGVQMDVVEYVCARIAASGKLKLCDIAELNPDLDIDNRTARAGARLVHRMATSG